MVKLTAGVVRFTGPLKTALSKVTVSAVTLTLSIMVLLPLKVTPVPASVSLLVALKKLPATLIFVPLKTASAVPVKAILALPMARVVASTCKFPAEPTVPWKLIVGASILATDKVALLIDKSALPVIVFAVIFTVASAAPKLTFGAVRLRLPVPSLPALMVFMKFMLPSAAISAMLITALLKVRLASADSDKPVTAI